MLQNVEDLILVTNCIFILLSEFVSGSAHCKNMHGVGNITKVAICRGILPHSIFGSEINGVNVAPT